MHILSECERQEEERRCRNTDVEVVTMAGWPGCVAYRPNATDDRGIEKRKSGERRMLGIHRIARAEVCVTFGPAIKPSSVGPENWLGTRLRAEMTARDQAKKAEHRTDENAAVTKVAGLGIAGLGVTVSAILWLKYAVGSPWILDEVMGYVGSYR